jgi:D-alanine-D-alanine ligase
MARTLALTYNLARDVAPGAPKDLYAEFDSKETVEAIRKALSSRGEVHPIEADENAYEKLKKLRPGIVFNIAEGVRGESRESQIPAMLEMLGIPYTGSGPLTLAITLNKARTKEVLSYHRVPTPEFRVYDGPPSKSDGLPLPAIIKPIAEGSSKGIREDSVVSTRRELIERVQQRIREYRQPVIAERFLDGREFTVAILGNKSPRVLPIVEILFDDLPPESHGIDSYEAKWIWDVPEKPLDCIRCPAEIGKRLEGEIKKVALDAYRALDCRDWSRLDMRLDEKGVPNVLEVNALPGMIANPLANSRFPAAARAAGLSHEQTILAVLDYALERIKSTL